MSNEWLVTVAWQFVAAGTVKGAVVVLTMWYIYGTEKVKGRVRLCLREDRSNATVAIALSCLIFCSFHTLLYLVVMSETLAEKFGQGPVAAMWLLLGGVITATAVAMASNGYRPRHAVALPAVEVEALCAYAAEQTALPL